MNRSQLIKLQKQLKEISSGEDQSFAGFLTCTENAILALRSAMFPQFFPLSKLVESSSYGCVSAYNYLAAALSYVCETEQRATFVADTLMEKLPAIKETLLTDVQAAYEGDPAAMSTSEVILTYPAFLAVFVYRIAHELYVLNIPLIPRAMSEYAHRITGIDIHPGATIGKRFFIDHGTGVVIGETTTIGENVKLYQHVTLGAKSFEAGEDGVLIKHIKRHPDIGNNVVIYAGATILGGSTKIGDHCVIGGNVWLTHSVKEGETVLATAGKTRHDDPIERDV